MTFIFQKLPLLLSIISLPFVTSGHCQVSPEAISLVQFSSVTQLCLILCKPTDAGFSCPSPTPGVYSNSCPLSWWCPPTISSCHPLLLQPSTFPSIRVFSNESALRIRWPKYWSFSFNISPSNEYSGLISFRMDWLDLLAVQGSLKSHLQHHSSKASILWCSAFFIVQLSHPYMTTGKTIALTRQTFVGKVMFLLFNMLYRGYTFSHFSCFLTNKRSKYSYYYFVTDKDFKHCCFQENFYFNGTWEKEKNEIMKL